MIPELRPRSVPEVIDAAVVVVRRHYLELMTVAVLYGVLGGFGAVVLFMGIQMSAIPDSSVVWVVVAAILALLFVFVLGLYEASTIAIIAGAYLGRPVSLAQAIVGAWKRRGAAAALTALRIAAIMAGFVLLVVPGIMLGLLFFAGMNALVVEGCGPVEALRRSKQLASGSLGAVLGLAVLCGIFVLIVRAATDLILVLVVPGLHANSPSVDAIGSVAGFLLQPFIFGAMTLLYFDFRIRKEGFDLDLMKRSIDQDVAATSQVRGAALTGRE